MVNVLVREESFPTSISGVIATNKFNRIESYFSVVDFSDADFASSDVATFCTEIFHAGER
jgi:hypothetical protein